MTYQFTLPSGQTLRVGEPFSIGAGDAKIKYPANWLEHASLQDLADHDIQRATIPSAPPPADPEMPPLPPSKDELRAHAVDKRQQLARSSTVVSVGERSIPVWADPESTGAITSLVVAASIVPTLTTNWKGADGAFYPLNAAEIIALALGMMGYVDACFQIERALGEQIDAGVITTYAQIDSATL